MSSFIRSYTIGIFSIFIVLGIYYSFFIHPSTKVAALLCIIGAAYLLTVILYKPAKASVFLFVIIICFGLATGFFRGDDVYKNQRYEFSRLYGTTITIIGTISDYPDERVGYTYLTISSIHVSSSTETFSEKVLVKAPLYPKYLYGQTIEVTGKVERPKDIHDDIYKSRFSYPRFLSVNNTYSTILYPKIHLVKDSDISLKSLLYNLKDRCIGIVNTYIPEPEAGLLVGILFGIKKAVDNDVLQTFVSAGVVHIVVLSGYNIAIVVEAVTRLFSRIQKRNRFLLSYLAIYVFVIFVGASSTVLRAGIMASIALFAKQFGRKGEPLQILAIATAAIGLYEPRMLVYDMSFKLSLLATIGLIVFTPKLSKVFSKVTNRFGVREVVASTIATQITVLPYLLYSMGRVSLVGVIANIFIVPVVPLVMLFGFVQVIIGFVYVPISMPVAYINYILLKAIVYGAHIFSIVPFSVLNTSISTLLLAVVYAIEFYFAVILLSSTSPNK